MKMSLKIKVGFIMAGLTFSGPDYHAGFLQSTRKQYIIAIIKGIYVQAR